MGYVSGTRLNDVRLLAREGYNIKKLAERLAHAVFHQIFMEGFFHADPHPGNIAALPGDSIVFMDFGMIGRLTPDMKDNFATLVIALMRQNTDGVIKAITKMGIVPDDVDKQMLTADVDLLRDKYYDIPFSQVRDRKSTRLNSSHVAISYAVFCLKKKKNKREDARHE